MRFWVEMARAAWGSGLVILGIPTTVGPVLAFLKSQSVAVALACLFAFLFVDALLAARRFYRQRTTIENTPQFKIDKVLRNALDLRDSLKYNIEGLDEREARIRTGALVVECVEVVNECAPAYVDDLNTKQLDNATGMLNVVSENYRVLAGIRKQLAGGNGA